MSPFATRAICRWVRSTVILNRRSPRQDLVDLAANVNFSQQTRADLLSSPGSS